MAAAPHPPRAVPSAIPAAARSARPMRRRRNAPHPAIAGAADHPGSAIGIALRIIHCCAAPAPESRAKTAHLGCADPGWRRRFRAPFPPAPPRPCAAPQPPWRVRRSGFPRHPRPRRGGLPHSVRTDCPSGARFATFRAARPFALPRLRSADLQPAPRPYRGQNYAQHPQSPRRRRTGRAGRKAPWRPR